MELEERVADLERQLMERVDVSVAKNLSLAVEEALRASQLTHDSNVILNKLLKDGTAHVDDLNRKIHWLIENYPGWGTGDCFTFPDGDTWFK